jgi:hypothetical protein
MPFFIDRINSDASLMVYNTIKPLILGDFHMLSFKHEGYYQDHSVICVPDVTEVAP